MQILKFFSPGLTVRWPCLRRLYMDTWMTLQNRRLSGARPICAYGRTAWPCRMPLLRWPCCSSSAAGCQKWLCLPPSTVITSLKPSQVVKRIFEEPRSLLQRLTLCLFESLFPVEGRFLYYFFSPPGQPWFRYGNRLAVVVSSVDRSDAAKKQSRQILSFSAEMYPLYGLKDHECRKR